MSDKDTGADATTSDETQLDTLREGIDDPQVLKEQLAREAQARRQLTARAIKAETEAKSLREASIKAEEPEQSTTTKTDAPGTEDERLELRLDGYSKEEVAYIMANGGRKVLEDKNSYTSIAITTRREQLKAEQAAGQTDTSGGEDSLRALNFNLPKNPNLNDLKKSISDMEKALPHAD
jgi:hypothetical protein